MRNSGLVLDWLGPDALRAVAAGEVSLNRAVGEAKEERRGEDDGDAANGAKKAGKTTAERAEGGGRGQKTLDDAAAEERIDEAIAELPEDERERARAIFERDGVPMVERVEIAGNLAETPRSERLRLYEHNESDDDEEQDLALTEAADRPATTPRAVALLTDAKDLLRQARQAMDEADLRSRVDEVVDAVTDLESRVRDAREAAAGTDRDGGFGDDLSDYDDDEVAVF